MAKQKSTFSFYEQLIFALKLALNPLELGAQSPLATPYFLGAYLSVHPLKGRQLEIVRGKALVSLLEDAAADLAEQHPRGEEFHHLLQLSYFQRHNRQDGSLWDLLGRSRAQYFRDRKTAVQALEMAVIRRVNPALRSESPVQQTFFAGREADIRLCQSGLDRKQVVGLAGPGGIGKTSLGAHCVLQFEDRPVFWYTVHLGINDHFSSLLFALAHFLHSHGGSYLWMQLIADRSQLDLEAVAGLLRADLSEVAALDPVFCIDEVDLLQPESEAHAQVLHFLESFPKEFGLLLIGQTVSVLTDVYIHLDAITTETVRQILQRGRIILGAEELLRLTEYTRGNPRLLNAYIALHKSGESIRNVLSGQTEVLSLEALINRVWVRLNNEERAVLLQLTVFRRPVPTDVWRNPAEQAALMQLMTRQLLQSDGHGAVSILSAFRRAMDSNLPAETRELLHMEAATVRAARSEFTAAAYHLVRAGKPDQAIRLWYPYRQAETDQGQADAALRLFEGVSRNQLTEQTDGEQLGLIRAKLHELLGNYDKAQATLLSFTWRTPRLAALARRLAGDVAQVGGALDVAANAYQEGLPLVETELALFHRDLGWIRRRQKSFDAALDEVDAALYEIEKLRGHIHSDLGDYTEAEEHYLRALALAEKLKMTESEAKTRNAFAAMLIKQGRFADAEYHFDRAHQIMHRIGKPLSMGSIRVNRAVAALLDGRARDAIAHAERARLIFERLNHPYGMACTYQTLAEAYLAEGDLDQAELFGWKAVETEESAVIPDALRVIGEVYLHRDALLDAERYILQAIDAAQENQDRYLEAYALRSLGKMYLLSDQDKAIRCLVKAESQFSELGLQDEAVRTKSLLS